MIRAHYEGAFPRACPQCGRIYSTYSDWVCFTQPNAGLISYDMLEGRLSPELGSVAYATCPCGAVVGIGSERVMPLEIRAVLLEWIRSACSTRHALPETLLEQVRSEIRSRVLEDVLLGKPPEQPAKT